MKKFFTFFSIAVMLLGLVAFTLPAIDTSPPDEDGSGGGGGGVTTWYRKDIWCTDKKVKQKTECTVGGNHQCTAQYCN